MDLLIDGLIIVSGLLSVGGARLDRAPERGMMAQTLFVTGPLPVLNDYMGKGQRFRYNADKKAWGGNHRVGDQAATSPPNDMRHEIRLSGFWDRHQPSAWYCVKCHTEFKQLDYRDIPQPCEGDTIVPGGRATKRDCWRKP